MHVEGRLAADWCSLTGSVSGPALRRVGDHVAIAELFDEILRHVERDTTRASVLRASGAAWHLMTRLADPAAESDAASDPIERAAEHLRRHYGEKVSVVDLAAIAGLSESYSAASFRRRLAGSP